MENKIEKNLSGNSIEKKQKPEVEARAEKIISSEEIEQKTGEDLETEEGLKEKIQGIETVKETTEEEKREKIEKYVEKNIPDYLKKEKESLVFRIFKSLSKFSVKEVIGKEELPQGEKLFIVNHRGGESGRLIAALDNPVRITSAETINWDGGGVFKWFLKKIGAVPIKETFSNLSEEQREKVVERAPRSEKKAHEKAVGNIGLGNLKNIKTMVALLLNGEDLAIFTEGPFSRLEDDDRKSYAGYALVAREYKRITGEDLEIVPTGIRNSKVSFGDSFHVDEEGRQSKEDLENVATEKIHNLYKSLE